MTFLGYRTSNVALVGGNWKLKILAFAARRMGVQFTVDGIPFGADRVR